MKVIVTGGTGFVGKRLEKRRNINPQIIKKFKKLQLPIEFKKKQSDFTIKNDFKSYNAKKNVKKVMKKILLNV